MKFNEFLSLTSPGLDQYDRKYPILIILNSGDELLAHSVSLSSETGEIQLQVISNTDDWIHNRITMGDVKKTINLNDINTAINYRNY
jgi:hypothetical protein